MKIIMPSAQKVVAVAYERFQLQGFVWEKLGVLDRWSLIGGGRLKEVVAHRGSTVFNWLVISAANCQSDPLGGLFKQLQKTVSRELNFLSLASQSQYVDSTILPAPLANHRVGFDSSCPLVELAI